MIKTLIIPLLASFLTAWAFTMANADLANAQQSSDSSASVLGDSIGTALGVRDGAARGANDDISGLGFNPVVPQLFPNEICDVYKDFYDTTVCDTTSVQYSDFYYAYQQGYGFGFIAGYGAGYYLDETLGTLYQPIR